MKCGPNHHNACDCREAMFSATHAKLEAAEKECQELKLALYDEHHGITHGLRVALFEEAVEAILNLAPGVRKERGGCFESRQTDCGCTVCKIRRWLALERPNVQGDRLRANTEGSKE